MEKLLGLIPGVTAKARLAGTYHRLDAPRDEHPLVIELEARVPSVARFVVERELHIAGTIDAPGLASRRRFEGVVQTFLIERQIATDFRFETDDGDPARFHGKQDLEAFRLLGSATTLPGSFFVADDEFARGVLRFDAQSELVKLLLSVRPKFSRELRP